MVLSQLNFTATSPDDTMPVGAWDPALDRYVIYVRRDVAQGRSIGRCVTDDLTDWQKSDSRDSSHNINGNMPISPAV